MKTTRVPSLLVSCLFLSCAGVDAGPPRAPFLVTNGADDGPGSLRAAIRDAAPQSTIEFTFTGVISLTSGELLLNKNLTIAGPGAAIVTISGQAFRIIEVSPTATIELSGLTLSDGHPIDAAGGAILNNGMLTLDDVRIANNSPSPTGFPVQSTVDGGGCLNSQGATLVMTNCTIIGNSCNGSGGGIINNGHLTLTNSTISGNSAGYGGGVFSTGTLTMVNCTVSGNEAISTGPHGLQGGYGGGIIGSGDLVSDTITGNGCVWHGGGISGSSGMTITNCILAANTSQSNPQDGDIDGTVQSHGYNLVGISTDNNGFGSTDLTGTPSSPLDPKLSLLQDNGGPTFTHALLIGSPAVDAGDPNSISPPEFDQRGPGFSRISHGRIDIGSFEVQAAAPSPTALGNISTRLQVGAGDNVLIGGFIVTGTQPKKVIVRAIGPSLSSLFTGVLADPVLELHGPSGFATITNDNWRSNQEAEIIATTVPPSDDLESAIVATLPANNSAYTAIVRGVNDGTGIGVVEAYDLDRAVDSKLGNISTRGLVLTGDNVIIGGLIVVGQSPLRVIVRAIGPSLSVPGALGDPTLELRDGNGVLLDSNDNWRSDQEAEISATGIPPANDLESAIVRNLTPGNYTAIVRGVGNTTGVGLVEAYGLN